MPSTSPPSLTLPSLSRRAVLAASVAGAGAALLGGCSSASDTKTTAASKAGCTGELAFNVRVPDARPGATLSDVPGVPVAWDSYPEAYKSVNQVPAAGGTFTTFQILYTPPPPPVSSNKYWQELNKRTGAEIDPNLAAADSYAQKLNLLAASGTFPDITYINFGTGTGADAFKKTVSQGAFTDLTQYLTGAGLEEFPNLQLFPEYAWKGSAFQGKLYGVPRPVMPVNGQVWAYRKDWAAKVGVDDPTNADEMFTMVTTIAKGSKSKGSNTWFTSSFGQALWNQLFRVPNKWRLEADGTLTNENETDEFEEALNFAIKVWKTGALYPDAATVTFQQSLDLFDSGRIAMVSQGFNPLMGMIGKASGIHKAEPKADVAPFIPPGKDGGDPLLRMEGGTFGFAAIPSSVKDEAKVKELLRVMDYYAAPFGSEEYTFMNFGMEGRHFKLDNAGSPTPLNNPKTVNELGVTYLCQPVEINFFFPEDPGLAKLAQDTQARAVKVAEPDPTLGLYSPTAVSKSTSLGAMGTDYYNGIVMGRKPVSALAEWRDAWKSRGGDKIRDELEKALAECG